MYYTSFDRHFCDTKIADILSETVDFKLVEKFKSTDRSGVNHSKTNNTNITEIPRCFGKPDRQKMAKLTAKYQNPFN